MAKVLLILFLSLLFHTVLPGKASRFRCMWRTDPATSMVIGWDQVSGADPIFYYDQKDFGTSAAAYRFSRRPDRIVRAKGMNNHFVRLEGLAPNTVYFFLIKDTEGNSRQFSFRTAPDSPEERLSIIAGGDSRNNRAARLSANRLVAKLRPHAIVFAGDMTDNDDDPEWREWFDDWQATFGSDGRIFPLIAARGNHEQNNQLMVDLFDIPSAGVYYSLTLGGSLLRILTLNSNLASGGEQRSWLENQLKEGQQVTWRFVQYHHSIRPHTSRKDEQNDMLVNWATLFYHYRVQLVLESDAHVVKCTYPIRPFGGPGNDEGFVRDDQNGTVYIGEGCWGSPLRDPDDAKSWTRQIGAFNQFKWIFVDRKKMEIRTIQTDVSDQVAEVAHQNVFAIPVGLSVWNPNNEDVIILYNHRQALARQETSAPAGAQKMEVVQLTAQERPDGVAIRWATRHETRQYQFEIQRLLPNGQEYLTLGKAPAKGEPANEYLFMDREYNLTPAGVLQYRIKCIHPDGSLSYQECQVDIKQKNAGDWSQFPLIQVDSETGKVEVSYRLQAENEMTIYIIDQQMVEIEKIPLGKQLPGQYRQPLNLSKIPRGNYLLILMSGRTPLGRYRVQK